jgi:Uma2 family endonuclease
MNQATVSDKIYTVQEYIAFEETSPVRHEFYKGKLYAMAGGSFNHNRIKRRVTRSLEDIFETQGCSVFDDGVKLQLIEDERYTYPDVFVTCEKLLTQEQYIVRNPQLIVEILSESTAEYDRTDKFKAYQKIESFKYYILIDSRQISVELFTRTEKKSIWTYQSFNDLNDIVSIPELRISISLNSIYSAIQFPLRISRTNDTEG